MDKKRVEDGYFFYRTQSYPCGKEYILVPAGIDEDNRPLFAAVRVYEENDHSIKGYRPIENAIAPKGYIWYSNCECRFGKGFISVLVR